MSKNPTNVASFSLINEDVDYEASQLEGQTDTDDVEEEVDELDDTNLDDVDTNDTVDDSTSDDDADDLDIPENTIHAIYAVSRAQGLILTDEDFEFDGSIDSLEELLDQGKAKIQEEMYAKAKAEFESQLPDTGKLLLNYMLSGGQDIEEFHALASANYESLDLTKEYNQKNVLQEYLSLTTKFSPEKIDRMIETYKTGGVLQEQAEEAVQELATAKQARLAEMETQAAIQREEDKKAMVKMQNELIVDYPINNDVKNNLPDFLFKPVRYADRDRPMTPFQYKMEQANNDPQKFLMLATMLMNDFSLEPVKKKVKTEQTRSLSSIIASADKLHSRQAQVSNNNKRTKSIFEGREIIKG
jgi:hypothetical protein